jgi:hypothetical protein
MGKWKKIVEGAKDQNVRLKDALEKSKMVRFPQFSYCLFIVYLVTLLIV